MGNLCLRKEQLDARVNYTPVNGGNPSETISVMVVGSSSVGKDSLVAALCGKGESVETGVPNSLKQKIIYNGRGIVFTRLKKSSSEMFQITIEKCMRESQVLLLCVDLSNSSTMQSFSDDYFEKVLEYQRTNLTTKGLRVIIVGCQCDKAVRNHKEEEELSTKCRQLSIPFIEVSSLIGTNIQLLLDSILSKEKNITPELVAEKIEILKNSRYLSMQSSLRDGSIMSLQPSLTRSKMSQPVLNVNGAGNISQQQQQFQGGNFEEESKIDSNSSSNNNNNNHQSNSNSNRQLDQSSSAMSSQQQQSRSTTMTYAQTYMRIIPHTKMYTKRIQLDKGNFGVVYRIELDGEECALKICKIEMKEDTALNRFQIIFSEAENMQKFMLNRNMRIMPLKGISFQVDMLREHVLIGYWMPLCQYSLKHLLKNSFNQIDFKRKIRWSLQIIECLEVFDKERIQHMDLKPQNILIDMHDDIVVSDLSMSKVFEEKQTEAFNMLGTTVKYAHPAAIINHELSPRFDIYSFGVILLELFTGKQPWGEIKRDELKEIYQQILNNPEVMNPLRYHAENYPKEMKYIQGKYSPIKDIIYLCCVAIFIKDKKDQVTINSIKMKFKELEESICGGDLD